MQYDATRCTLFMSQTETHAGCVRGLRIVPFSYGTGTDYSIYILLWEMMTDHPPPLAGPAPIRCEKRPRRSGDLFVNLGEVPILYHIHGHIDTPPPVAVR